MNISTLIKSCSLKRTQSSFQYPVFYRSLSLTSRCLLKKTQFPPRPKINEDDIEEVFIKGGGKGGQKINKTNSKVQLKHIPTGIVVSSQFSRSREQNRKKAREILALKIEELTAPPGESRTAIIAEYKKNKARKKKSKSKKKYAAREAAMREAMLQENSENNTTKEIEKEEEEEDDDDDDENDSLGKVEHGDLDGEKQTKVFSEPDTLIQTTEKALKDEKDGVLKEENKISENS